MASQSPRAASSSEQGDGYACVIREDWNARALNVRLPQGLTPVEVKRGDQVWAFRHKDGFYLIRVPFKTSFVSGWVPARIVERGNRYTNPLPIQLLSQARSFQVGALHSTAPSQNALQETLRSLWLGIKNQESTITQMIPGLSENSKKILFHDLAPSYADLVYQGVVPQAHAIMDSGVFTMEALRNLPSVNASYPKEPGVYLILYNDFGGRQTGNREFQTAIYVGQTVDFQKRKDAHSRITATGARGSNHYRLAAQAQRKVMVPIVLKKSSNVPDAFLDIAEFSMVCLFRSWFVGLFKPSDSNTLGAYVTDFDACLTFSRLMTEVSGRTGWNPGYTYGLNWNTPILQNVKRHQHWTSWYDPRTEIYTYRTRRRLEVRPDSFTIDWHPHQLIQVPNEVGRAAGFVHGQTVHIVAELRKRGSEYLTHPFRFVRFPPTIGQNSELEKLRSLAVKIQWLDGTQWKECYLERSVIWPTVGNPPVLRYYITGLSMLCDIEEVNYSGGPAWLPSRSHSQVQFLRYDHLGQKFAVEIIQPRTIPWPRDHTMQENTSRLTQMFPRNRYPDTVIGPRPAPGFWRGTRSACDMCFSQHTCCRPLNRQCTWTRGEGLQQRLMQEGDLEELGIAVNLTRNAGQQIKVMAEPPFDPNLEAEEHGELEA
ncbi:hypothetical protein ACJ41O_007579 [Fusarium nematophilum]